MGLVNGDKGSIRIDREVIDGRRAIVARLKARGFSTRLILQAMERQAKENAEPGAETNPETSKVWSREVVRQDSKWLDAEWRRQCFVETNNHKARVFAELQEVKRQAWSTGKLKIVLDALVEEIELLGLTEPTRVDLRVFIRERAEAMGLDAAEVLAEAEKIFNPTKRRRLE